MLLLSFILVIVRLILIRHKETANQRHECQLKPEITESKFHSREKQALLVEHITSGGQTSVSPDTCSALLLFNAIEPSRGRSCGIRIKHHGIQTRSWNGTAGQIIPSGGVEAGRKLRRGTAGH